MTDLNDDEIHYTVGLGYWFVDEHLDEMVGPFDTHAEALAAFKQHMEDWAVDMGMEEDDNGTIE